MNDTLANVHNPITLASIAVIVGGVVRVLKTNAVSDWLDRLPPAWLKRIPKAYLPWLALVLGFVIAYFDLVLNARVSWGDAFVPSLAGVLAGAAAVGGHETIAKFLGQFIFMPKGPVDPDGPLGPPDVPEPEPAHDPKKAETLPAPPLAPTSNPPFTEAEKQAANTANIQMINDTTTILTSGFMSCIAAAFMSVVGIAIMVVACAVGTPGCAAFASSLPVIIASVVDGMQVIDAIATFVNTYFVAHPDPAAQLKVASAVARCKEALNLALRLAQGTQDSYDQKVDAAFDDFKNAYMELIALTQPYGVKPAPTAALRATPNAGTLEVPEPLAFKNGSKK